MTVVTSHSGWSAGAKFDDRNDFSVTLLATGKVLVAGGFVYIPHPTHFVASALLYDPTTLPIRSQTRVEGPGLAED